MLPRSIGGDCRYSLLPGTERPFAEVGASVGSERRRRRSGGDFNRAALEADDAQSIAGAGEKTAVSIFEKTLTAQHFNNSFAFATIDTSVSEIDALDRSPLAGEIDDSCAGALIKAVAHAGFEGLIVFEDHNHIENFDRRIFDSQLKLLEAAFMPADIYLVVIVSKIYLPPP
jgi:hypothetical protein